MPIYENESTLTEKTISDAIALIRAFLWGRKGIYFSSKELQESIKTLYSNNGYYPLFIIEEAVKRLFEYKEELQVGLKNLMKEETHYYGYKII